MKTKLARVGLWLALAAPVQAQTPTAPALPPAPAAEVFFRVPDLTAAKLSPSGAWLAVSVGLQGKRLGLAVFDVSGATPPKVLANFSDIDVGGFRWVNDDRLVFDLVDTERGSGDAQYAPGLFAIERATGATRQLIQMRVMAFGRVANPERGVLGLNHRPLHVPGDGGNRIIVGEYRFNRWGEPASIVPKLMDVTTGAVTTIARGTPADAKAWLFDAKGQAALVVAGDEGRRRVYWHADPASEAADSWVLIGDHEALNAPWEPVSVDGAGQLYVTVSDGPGGEAQLKRFDFKTGEPEREPVVSTPGFDFTGVLLAENDGDRLLGVRAYTDAETTVWMEPRLKALQAAIDQRLPGRVNRIDCRKCQSPEATVLVTSMSDREPGQYWVWRGPPEAPTLFRLVGRVRQAVNPQQMATLDFARFAARDGRGIPVWITTPAVPPAGGTKPPAVVLVHGGPWVRGGHWHWDPMPQFLASRGYVVIEPEFRGSTGFGSAHFRAGWKQWGRAMQDDVADAVLWAADKGLIDPKRVCIAGASYGGYATLMGLVRHPELYRCGAAWVAVTEPALLFDAGWENDISREARLHRMPVLLGDPVADAEMLREVSPVVQAARIKAPLLLAYGERDRRVPLEHGKRLREAMQAAGREPEYVVYDGEGHAWRRTSTRVDFAERLERFLSLHLK
ncbi:MAG: S9 family peptidase [Rubrivivax sp.]|nr:S9 family peptidase [Rubrivivax sp.]